MPTFHRCEIRDADGHVVASEVRVALEERDAATGAGWYGTITVTHLATLVSGQSYRLVLDDGRSGEFRVRRNTFAGDVNRAVAVDGVGSLRGRE
jgi:hypothetical protein